jgi:predicted Rossmann fold nucleotide-binding protein DprA/Smf involved in DNA uptake
MCFAHTKGFSNKRKMEFLIQCVHDKRTIEEAMAELKKGDKLEFDFSEKEWNGIQESIKELPNYSFLAEELINSGIKCIHVMEADYPRALKKNLQKEAPIVLYAKGNIELLAQSAVAVVGARKAGVPALTFTHAIAKKVINEKKLVVSGFAKGVDRAALDGALNNKGKSIIILPQGIMTYTTKTYYPNIVSGDVLVVSTYHPKVPWSISLAMDRNKTIYGMAADIYVAESDSKGGTWEGVINGLKRGRKIFVRLPDSPEKNANVLLIKKGALAVNKYGDIQYNIENTLSEEVNEPESEGKVLTDKDIVSKTIQLLGDNDKVSLTSNQIIKELNVDVKGNKLTTLLKNCEKVLSVKKGRSYYFSLIEDAPKQTNLF